MTIDNTTISVVKTFSPPVPVSNLLFASNFAANTSLAPFTYGAQGRAFFSGTDAGTGFAWPVSGGGSGQALNTLWTDCYLIPYTGTTLTAGNINNYGRATIRAVTGPDGTTENELFLELLDAGLIATGTANVAYGAQMPFEFLRITDGTPTPPALDDIYISYYFKRPGSLLTDLPTGGNATISILKTGGHDGLYGGDLRILLNIFKDAAGNLYWKTECDRDANGTMTTDPSGILSFDMGGSFKYWKESNKSVPVVLDAWNKCEIYIHRHAKNGIVLIAINDQIICYHVGRTLGEFGYQWGRIMIQNVYGSHKIGSAEVVRVRVRDYPPAGSALQLPAASLLYKYG